MMHHSGYQNNYPSYDYQSDSQTMLPESPYYQQSSSQYYVPHQNDKKSSSSKLGFLNSIPSSITVTKEKVRIPSPVKNQDDHDDDFFNVHLTYDEMGMEDVIVEGNKRMFIKTIHDELLNFLKTYAVPLKSVCFHTLNKSNDKELKEFFSRKEWDCLRREEKLLYHYLNDWVTEPVLSRILNLINTETDAKRLETLTQIYNKLAPQETVTLESPVPASPSPPSPEIQEIPQEKENVTQNIPDESGMELLAKLRENVAPGPPRTKTTEEERTAVKEWGLRNPNADANQRKDLAASLGLTKLTVDRLVVYANKNNSGGHFSLPARYKNNRLVEKKVKPNSNKATLLVPQNTQVDLENWEQNGKATLLVPQRTQVDLNKMDNVRSLVKKVNDPPNSNISQSSQVPSKSITDAIKNAVKAGSLKGVDFKKPLKIVVMPPKDKAKVQSPQQQHQYISNQYGLTNNAALSSTAQNNKYNEVALSSYFKNKPFPTDEEIKYFVECTRVPFDVTKSYVEKVQEMYKETKETSQEDQYSHQKNLQQEYSQDTQDQQEHYYTDPQQQYSQEDHHYSQDDYQYSHENDPENRQYYSQNPQELYESEQARGNSPGQQFESSAAYPSHESNADIPDFFDQQAADSGPHYGGGLIPELSMNQKKMFQDFIQRNPHPEMPAIVEFSEKIGMAFENVLLTLELDFNIFNNSPSFNEQQKFPQDDKALLFASLDPEISQLICEIQDFKGEEFSPILEQELKSMFGNKIFCNVDNVKSFALAKNLNFANIYKKLNSNNDSVMLVSDETCKRLLDAATENKNSPGVAAVNNGTDHIKKESPAQVPNDWMTSSELNFENMMHSEVEGEYVEYEDRSPKRELEDQEFSENKKIKLESRDDSGYGVSDVSRQTDDSFHMQNVDSGEAIMGDIITENIGDVNMLDDSLNIFSDSIGNIDLVNDLFQKVEKHNFHSVAPKTVSEIEYGDILASLKNSDNRPKTNSKEKVKDGNLRKLFRGPIQNFSPAFQVISIKPSFKPYILEVELSDGRECSDNFYFKSGAEDLKLSLVIKLKTVRYVGSKICVDSYEMVEHRDSLMGDPLPIENEFSTCFYRTAGRQLTENRQFLKRIFRAIFLFSRLFSPM